MKNKILRIAVVSLVLCGLTIGSIWILTIRSALPYLKLLSSGESEKICEAGLQISGLFKVQTADGKLQWVFNERHKPLEGVAARAVKRKVLNILENESDIKVIDALLRTGDAAALEERTSGYYFTGDDLKMLSAAIDKYNNHMSGDDKRRPPSVQYVVRQLDGRSVLDLQITNR